MLKRFFLVLTAFAAASAQGPSVEQIASRLTAAGLKADVSFLASDVLQGRGTPSPGLDIAAEFIAAQFRRAGLEPAGDDGYFQTAKFATITPNLDGFELTLDVGGQTFKADKASMLVQDPAAIDLSHAAIVSTDPAGIDALTPDQVRGKALLVTIPQGAPFNILRTLTAAYDRLQPALVILVRDITITAAQRNVRVQEVTAARRPVVTVTDPAIRAAAANLKDATVSIHMAAPTVAPVPFAQCGGRPARLRRAVEGYICSGDRPLRPFGSTGHRSRRPHLQRRE
jgi:hypothetical protein